ncbi:carbohydrate porin [Waterburya agarophytonicola K14]|uniref:Carbohydrate porin n=1 Tax=Waterburya agarophytonicola KI4 TaxID=2874699 RepID=A0A964BSM4_9CYAN|nr:iron uptake porin [Waterburya agarophytonicola]MCC0177467.1 carbohydrate porin [Waterburya agarophytonicola KI4]
MNKLFWQAAKVAPILFATSLFTANSAGAQTITADKGAVNETLEQINNYQQSNQDSLPQVTNVNQLRDVSPTDWAYEALRSLVDRYGCISGFPNQTYRGNQPLSRYEFAAGLNSCLNQIERLIASQDSVGTEELETIQRLTQEFEAELATIGGRVDEIESRTAVLEDSQFSTTTKLKGEVIFNVSDAFGGGLDATSLAENALIANGTIQEGENPTDEQVQAFVGDVNNDGQVNEDDVNQFEDDSEIDDEAAFSNRVRLNFDTSFYGKDRLRARLQAANVPDYGDVTGTDSARLAFDGDNGNSVELSKLYYQFPLTERVTGYVGTTGLGLDDIFNPGNPTLESSGSGALTRFNRYNPLVFRGTDGAGGGATLDIIPDKVAVTALYLTDNANDTAQREGLFNGSFSAGGQIEFTPFEALQLSATYVRNYQTGDSVNQSGSTVSGFATEPFNGIDTTANKVGVNANFEVGEKISLGGFGGYADVKGLVQGDNNNPSGQIWTWGANVSILDLVKEGSQLSFAGGMVPKFTSDIGAEEVAAGVQEDQDTSYLVEAQYKFPLNDNISITPGAYAVFNPNHVSDNDTVYAGVLRTTFQF